jgi:site-specific recombinase XerD
MKKQRVVNVTGPLAPYASGFGRELRQRGYTDLSAAQQLRLMAHASRWLAARDLAATALSPEEIESFCVERRAAGYRGLRTAKAVGPLQEFLQGQGVSPTPTPSEPVSADEKLLEHYRNYLVNERGLVANGVSSYVRSAAAFLAGHPGVARGSGVNVAEVHAFCVRELPERGGSAAQHLASGLRSFLRFLHVAGLVNAPLAQAVPPVARRRGSVVRGVSAATLSQLLASCDRRRDVGRRDYAMVLVLARYGLRAGEVTRLTLDDIDWRNGELVVRGKGGRDARLPLPADVGAAIAGYLRRGRPRSEDRAVFLRAIAPRTAMSPPAVTHVVYAACDRAGVARIGAHRLRHSAATQMLRGGASLSEVAQVLRHVNLATTAIYAKVDFVSLRPLAPSWPGGAA